MSASSSFKLSGKLQDYKLLIKFNLSFMVVFSALISYLLAPKVREFDWTSILLFFLGGMLVTGSANTINQVVEKDTDALMKRTANRPVASGRMSVQEAWTFAVLAGLAGVAILGWRFNILSAVLAAFSLFLYAFIYTPLKKISSISVLGAHTSWVIGGTVVIETVFALPGLGSLFVESIFSRDYPLIQGLTIVFAVLVVLINLATDLAYALADPRIRLE